MSGSDRECTVHILYDHRRESWLGESQEPSFCRCLMLIFPAIPTCSGDLYGNWNPPLGEFLRFDIFSRAFVTLNISDRQGRQG